MAMNNKAVMWGFAVVCLACLAGVGFVLFDATRTTFASTPAAFGVVAVYIMLIGFAVRALLSRRQD